RSVIIIIIKEMEIMSKSIILDAGHGGSDVGATGNGLLEKNLTLKMTNYQYNRLKELGAKVQRTRSGDQTVSSTKRTQIVRQSGADVCISNHFNASNGKGRGVETIHSYLAKNTFAKNLRSEEHTSELQSRFDIVCRLLLEKKKKKYTINHIY